MSRLRRFLLLSTSERSLLLEGLLAVGAARIALWFLPFRILRRALASLPPRAADRRRRPSGEISRAVAAAGRVVPGTTCLVEALATQAILRRNGHDAEVRFGVAKSESGGIDAHAWVESGEMIIGCGAEVRLFEKLAGPRQK